MERNELRKIVITSLCEATDAPFERYDLADDTPMSQLAIDSMVLFSVLLTVERKLEQGDISQLSSETPPPKHFGDLIQLAAKIGKLDHLL